VGCAADSAMMDLSGSFHPDCRRQVLASTAKALWHNSFGPSKAAEKIDGSGRHGRHLGGLALSPSGWAHDLTLGCLAHRQQLSC
jgi:hypothetical protein